MRLLWLIAVVDDATGVNVGEIVVDIGEGFEDFGEFVYDDILGEYYCVLLTLIIFLSPQLL